MGQSFSVKIRYYDGSINKVDTSTKESVKNSLNSAISKLEPEFFKGVSIHVASDFSNLDEHSLFSRYLLENEDNYSNVRGMTSTDPINREIYIQETSFWRAKLNNLFSKRLSFTANEEIKNSIMHEIGHQYDLYYGGDAFLKEEYKKLAMNHPDGNTSDLSDKEKSLLNIYYDYNGYSDDEEFKSALLKDFQTLDTKEYTFDFNYYVSGFYPESLEKVPTEKVIQDADYSRGEMFAQLFSYAMGTDDGNASKFKKLFPNAYKKVQEYINEHSKPASTNKP